MLDFGVLCFRYFLSIEVVALSCFIIAFWLCDLGCRWQFWYKLLTVPEAHFPLCAFRAFFAVVASIQVVKRLGLMNCLC